MSETTVEVLEGRIDVITVGTQGPAGSGSGGGTSGPPLAANTAAGLNVVSGTNGNVVAVPFADTPDDNELVQIDTGAIRDVYTKTSDTTAAFETLVIPNQVPASQRVPIDSGSILDALIKTSDSTSEFRTLTIPTPPDANQLVPRNHSAHQLFGANSRNEVGFIEPYDNFDIAAGEGFLFQYNASNADTTAVGLGYFSFNTARNVIRFNPEAEYPLRDLSDFMTTWTASDNPNHKGTLKIIRASDRRSMLIRIVSRVAGSGNPRFNIETIHSEFTGANALVADQFCRIEFQHAEDDGLFTFDATGNATGANNRSLTIRGTISSSGHSTRLPVPVVSTATRDSDTTLHQDGQVVLNTTTDQHETYYNPSNAAYDGSTQWTAASTGTPGFTVAAPFTLDGNRTVPATGNIDGRMFVSHSDIDDIATIWFAKNDGNGFDRTNWFIQKLTSSSATLGFLDIEIYNPLNSSLTGEVGFPISAIDTTNSRYNTLTVDTAGTISKSNDNALGGNGSRLQVFVSTKGDRGETPPAGTLDLSNFDGDIQTQSGHKVVALGGNLGANRTGNTVTSTSGGVVADSWLEAKPVPTGQENAPHLNISGVIHNRGSGDLRVGTGGAQKKIARYTPETGTGTKTLAVDLATGQEILIDSVTMTSGATASLAIPLRGTAIQSVSAFTSALPAGDIALIDAAAPLTLDGVIFLSASIRDRDGNQTVRQRIRARIPSGVNADNSNPRAIFEIRDVDNPDRITTGDITGDILPTGSPSNVLFPVGNLTQSSTPIADNANVVLLIRANGDPGSDGDDGNDGDDGETPNSITLNHPSSATQSQSGIGGATSGRFSVTSLVNFAAPNSVLYLNRTDLNGNDIGGVIDNWISSTNPGDIGTLDIFWSTSNAVLPTVLRLTSHNTAQSTSSVVAINYTHQSGPTSRNNASSNHTSIAVTMTAVKTGNQGSAASGGIPLPTGSIQPSRLYGTNASGETVQIDPTTLPDTDTGFTSSRVDTGSASGSGAITTSVDSTDSRRLVINVTPPVIPDVSGFLEANINTNSNNGVVIKRVSGRFQAAVPFPTTGAAGTFLKNTRTSAADAGLAVEWDTINELPDPSVADAGRTAKINQNGVWHIEDTRTKIVIQASNETAANTPGNGRGVPLNSGRPTGTGIKTLQLPFRNGVSGARMTLADFTEISIKVRMSLYRSLTAINATNWFKIDIADLIADPSTNPSGFDSLSGAGPNGHNIVMTPSLHTATSTSLTMTLEGIQAASSDAEEFPEWNIWMATGWLT